MKNGEEMSRQKGTNNETSGLDAMYKAQSFNNNANGSNPNLTSNNNIYGQNPSN
jgi:hypothetical protein